ncbi:MAG TPA: alpha-L-arabinofuranosidase, partial [bacterium]
MQRIKRAGLLFLAAAVPLLSQNGVNCFLEDFMPKYAAVPPYKDAAKTTEAPLVTVTINAADTLGKVSKYIFGNAVAVWVAQSVNNSVLLKHLQKLSPTLIRFPGGNWSHIYFWDENPGDLPSTIPDGRHNGQKIALNPQFGAYYSLTVDEYYSMRNLLSTQGLITVNYGYARYGLSKKPAEQAAHVAADWVRYDDGRTKFWEIGNECSGQHEAGWQIDTALNQDGQPEIITGELYGKHFKIFADSMRAAADELGETIAIGGIIVEYNGTNSANIAVRKWNEGFFKEAGDAADFYVIHDYFGEYAASLKLQVDYARSAVNSDINFVRQDIVNKKASS